MKTALSPRLPGRSPTSGFTLVELLVATTILLMLMFVIFSTLDQTGRLWRNTTQKVETFQGARAAFEALTRNLSQATLNAYWMLDDRSPSLKYERQSHLHFMLGQAKDPRLLGNPAIHPTHAVFFQSPLGYTASGDDPSKPNYEGLDDLLTACGYFIEYADDKSLPAHVPPRPRKRFRLFEMLQPTEELRVYEFNPVPPPPATRPPNDDPKKWEWISEPLKLPDEAPDNGPATTPIRPTHVLAENVIALVLVPKLSKHDQGTGKILDFPNYEYDSRDTDPSRSKSLHQLPPIVQVTLVAIDEASALRKSSGDVPPTWTEGLFEKASSEDDVAADLTNTLIPTLRKEGINYRIFTSDVSIRGSKWSTQ